MHNSTGTKYSRRPRMGMGQILINISVLRDTRTQSFYHHNWATPNAALTALSPNTDLGPLSTKQMSSADH